MEPDVRKAASTNRFGPLRGQYEPAHGPIIVRPIAAHYTERVRITWTYHDGSTWTEDIWPLPVEVVEARRKYLAENPEDAIESGETHGVPVADVAEPGSGTPGVPAVSGPVEGG